MSAGVDGNIGLRSFMNSGDDGDDNEFNTLSTSLL